MAFELAVGTTARPPGVAEAVLALAGPGDPTALMEALGRWGAAEWAAARWAAQVHGVAPLLYAQLRDTPLWPALDPELRSYLAAQARQNRARVERMQRELAAILRAAAGAGLAALPLKGAVLAAHYYPDAGLRPLADLDLLVRPAELPAWGPLLDNLGYDAGEHTVRHQSYVRRGAETVRHTDGEHPDNPRGVELHGAVGERLWTIAYDATQRMWSSVTPADYGGVRAIEPAPVALLEHLLIHVATDLIACKARLIRLYDLALVARRLEPADWATLHQAAVAHGEARLFYAPLLLAERYCGPLAPPGLIDALAARSPASLRTYLSRTSLSEMSLCKATPASLGAKLSWFRPAERPAVLRALALPTPHELHEQQPRLHGIAAFAWAYLAYLARALGWPLRRAFGLPRRAWRLRERGGR